MAQKSRADQSSLTLTFTLDQICPGRSNVLRRRLLVTVGAAALTGVPCPFPVPTDLLDTRLGHSERKATKPITTNDEWYLMSYRSPPTIRVDAWSLSVTDQCPTENMSQPGNATGTFCATASSFARHKPIQL